jgi:hypothetical protein
MSFPFQPRPYTNVFSPVSHETWSVLGSQSPGIRIRPFDKSVEEPAALGSLMLPRWIEGSSATDRRRRDL